MGEDRAAARYLSEFLGTFVLVATVCGNVHCNILFGSAPWAGVSIACSLTVMIYALGKSSGAHFNPAVSVCLAIAGKCPVGEALIYIVFQIMGGMLASLILMAMHHGTGIPLHPIAHHAWWQAGLAEMLYTFMLCFVVLNVACSKMHAGKNQFYGIAIGFVIIAGGYGAGNISMGCFNPSVAFALDFSTAVVAGEAPSWFSLMYTGFELVGAALAAVVYRLVRPEDYTPDMDGSEGHSMFSKLLSEFLGTYFLVLTVGLNVLTESAAAAFSIASCLMCMIFALGTVSGAHFNPAVTLAIVASGRGKCSTRDAVQYIAVQFVAGILAARTYCLLTGETFDTLKPPTSSWLQVLTAELIWTAVLCFVVLSVATVKNVLTEYFGFAIGMCVSVGGFAIGKISAGSLNPAVSLGIATSSSLAKCWHFFPYMLIELLAGAMAAGLFYASQPSEFEEDDMIMDTLTDKAQEA